jgi:hypothetical protein
MEPSKSHRTVQAPRPTFLQLIDEFEPAGQSTLRLSKSVSIGRRLPKRQVRPALLWQRTCVGCPRHGWITTQLRRGQAPRPEVCSVCSVSFLPLTRSRVHAESARVVRSVCDASGGVLERPTTRRRPCRGDEPRLARSRVRSPTRRRRPDTVASPKRRVPAWACRGWPESHQLQCRGMCTIGVGSHGCRRLGRRLSTAAQFPWPPGTGAHSCHGGVLRRRGFTQARAGCRAERTAAGLRRECRPLCRQERIQRSRSCRRNRRGVDLRRAPRRCGRRSANHLPATRGRLDLLGCRWKPGSHGAQR